jgi:hypothetical protein
MRTDDIEELLDQINLIQEVLNEYHIEDAVFYGSRVLGRHQETSDFDLSCQTNYIEKVIRRNPDFYPQENINPKRLVDLTLEEAGAELAFKLKSDISLTSVESDEELTNSIRHYHVPLIRNGVRQNRDELLANIQDLRSKRIPSQTERSLEAQEFYLMTRLASLTSIARFIELIEKKSDFTAPKAQYKQAIRNEIIHNIAIFSLCTEKVKESLFEQLPFKFDELKRISSLVRSKQHARRNYNTLEVGWAVCGTNDLDKKELEMFSDFFFHYQKELLLYLLNNKNHPIFEWSFHIFQRGLEEKTQLKSFFRNELISHQAPLQKTPFKNILNAAIQREDFFEDFMGND